MTNPSRMLVVGAMESFKFGWHIPLACDSQVLNRRRGAPAVAERKGSLPLYS